MTVAQPILSGVLSPILSNILGGGGSFAPTYPEFNTLGIAQHVFKYHEMDSELNVTHTLQQSFNSSAVDTTNNYLVLPDIGFQKENYPSARCGFVREVYFRPATLSDVLPTGLVQGTKYYIATTDTLGATRNYKVYPAVTDSDGANIPGWVEGENVLPGQAIAQDVLNIDFTDQGTGNFVIFSREGIESLADLSGNNLSSSASPTKRNEYFDTGTDEQGRKYLDCEGSIAKNEPEEGGGYNGYGKGYLFDNRDASRAFVSEKRSIMHAFVFTPTEPIIRNVPKFYSGSAGVNTTNDTIAPLNIPATVSRIINGGETFVRAVNGGTLPAGIPVGGDPAQSTVMYSRETGAGTKTYTLHPTRTDALNNTNKINITSTGSGSFILYQPKFAGDNPRNGYFTKWLVATGAGNNVGSGNLNFQTFNNTGLFTFDIIVTSGSNNGNFGTGVPGIATESELPDLSPVDLTMPDAAVAPTRVDTGLPLANGTYYITRAPDTSETIRFHDTLENAAANIGVATSSATCIKFSSAGDGAYGGFALTHANACDYDIRHEAPPGSTPTRTSPLVVNELLAYDKKHQVITVIDFNSPDETLARVKVWFNGVQVLNVENGGKGLTSTLVVNGVNAGTILNSDQFHVPFKGRFYAGYFGSSDGEITDAEVLEFSNSYLKPKYATFVPEPAQFPLSSSTIKLSSTAVRMSTT